MRVRAHSAAASSSVARVEVAPEKVAEFAAEHAREAARRLRELGFAYVALDLEGYRMGSVNEVLPSGGAGVKNGGDAE